MNCCIFFYQKLYLLFLELPRTTPPLSAPMAFLLQIQLAVRCLSPFPTSSDWEPFFLGLKSGPTISLQKLSCHHRCLL